MLYNEGIESQDIWLEVSRFFMKENSHMSLQKFYTENTFGILIGLRLMASQEMHGSGTRLVKIKDGVQLEIERDRAHYGTDQLEQDAVPREPALWPLLWQV